MINRLKQIRFYLVWLLAAPFVFLFLIGSSLVSGQWSLVVVKFQLIHMSLYQRYGVQKPQFGKKAK